MVTYAKLSAFLESFPNKPYLSNYMFLEYEQADWTMNKAASILYALKYYKYTMLDRNPGLIPVTIENRFLNIYLKYINIFVQ